MQAAYFYIGRYFMKKRFVLPLTVLMLFTVLITFGCSKVNRLYSRLSELRLNLYEGESENYSLRAHYGFCETPNINDGTVGEKVYKLTFKIVSKTTEDADYSVSFTFNETPYKSPFKSDPISGNLIATVETENFNLNEFKVYVCTASSSETVTLKSTVSETAIDYKTALDRLNESQSTMLDGYLDGNGNLSLEIRQRIITKNQTDYWYIGLIDADGNLKALLMDASDGKVLAIRDVF